MSVTLEALRATGHLRTVYTVHQVAAALGMSRSAAYEEVATGRLPSTEIGGRRRVTIGMLLEYIEQREGVARKANAK